MDQETYKMIEVVIELMDAYPKYRRREDDRKRIAIAYAKRLTKAGLSLADVERACENAPLPGNYPEQFPNVGELILLVQRGRNVRDSNRDFEQHEMTGTERYEAQEAAKLIPRSPEAQVAYITEGDTESEKLARLWECENKLSGRKPWDDTPPEVADRRFRDINAILARLDVDIRPEAD